MIAKQRLFARAGIGLLCAGLVAAIWFEPTYIGRGLIRREHFYRYRPTSYWRTQFAEAGQAGEISKPLFEAFFGKERAHSVISDLITDPDPNVRWTAVVLESAFAGRSANVDVYRRWLSDSEARIRQRAAWALGQMGSNAKSACPRLIELLHDPDKNVAQQVEQSLWEIDPKVAIEHAPWRKFQSGKWQFSVLFPADPEVTDATSESPFGAVRSHTFLVKFETWNFAVAVFEYPDATSKALTIQQRYDALAKYGQQFFKEKLHREVRYTQTPATLCGRSGVRGVVETEGGPSVESRSVIIGPRSYLVQAVYLNSDESTPDQLEAFFDSFGIGYEPDAKGAK